MTWTQPPLDLRRTQCGLVPTWSRSTKGVQQADLRKHRRAGAPGRIRTFDRRIRSPMLYPAELRALGYIMPGQTPFLQFPG
jgi:hypothetical protein